jgi:exonuclease III
MVNNSLSLLTLNIQGLRAPNNRATLFSWLNYVQADIICLQETHSTSVAEFESWVLFETNAGNNLQQYSVISSPGSVRSAGVAVLYKPSLKLDATFRDDVGRLVIAHFSDPSCDSSPFQMVNIYGPNRRQLGEDLFTSILQQIDPSLPTFLCGDFNTVVDPHIDRSGCNPSSYWSYNWPESLSLLTSQLDLVDAWRRRHPTDRHFTWHRPCGSQAFRLDMVWIPNREHPSPPNTNPTRPATNHHIPIPQHVSIITGIGQHPDTRPCNKITLYQEQHNTR